MGYVLTGRAMDIFTSEQGLCYILGYLARQKAKRNKIDTGEEIGRGAGSENRERTEEGIPPEL